MSMICYSCKGEKEKITHCCCAHGEKKYADALQLKWMCMCVADPLSILLCNVFVIIRTCSNTCVCLCMYVKGKCLYVLTCKESKQEQHEMLNKNKMGSDEHATLIYVVTCA